MTPPDSRLSLTPRLWLTLVVGWTLLGLVCGVPGGTLREAGFPLALLALMLHLIFVGVRREEKE